MFLASLHCLLFLLAYKNKKQKKLTILLKNEFLSSFFCNKPWFREAVIIHFYLSLKLSSSDLRPNVSPGRDGTKVCPLCENHLDLQKFSFQCSKVTENIEITVIYSVRIYNLKQLGPLRVSPSSEKNILKKELYSDAKHWNRTILP
jgi:hypothetical protein